MKKHLLKLLLLCCTGILALSLFACVPTTEQYKVDFIVDGQVYKSCTTSGNSRVTLPSDPTKTAYVFKGWYFDEGKWTKEFNAHSFEKEPIEKDVNIYARFELDKTHTCNKLWKNEVQPTCLSEGKRVQRCSYPECAKVYAVETLPVVKDRHTGEIEAVKTNVIPATCTTEGSYTEMYYCSVCKAKLEGEEGEKSFEIPIDNNAHKYVDDINHTKLVKDGDVFNLNVKCEYCAFEVSLDNIDVTEKIVKNATCTETGSKYYICSVYGVEFISATEIIPAKGHYINGVAIEDKVYSEKTHSKIFSKITLVADGNTSEGTDCWDRELTGIYECDVCHENNYISVLKPHKGTWVKTADPECYKNGKEVLATCYDCEVENAERIISKTEAHKDGETILVKKNGNKFNLELACVNRDKGCDHTVVMVENVEVTSKEVISKDCKVDDVIRYTHKAGSKTYYYDESIGSGHILNGVRAETLQDPAGWFDYRYVGNGIKIFDNIVLTCDTDTSGMYTCESCKQDILVSVYRPHKGSWTTTTQPTCTSTGVSTFKCELCDYGHDGMVTKTLEKLDHKYDFKLYVASDNTFYLDGTCVCGKTERKNNVSVTVTVAKNPTCKERGEIIYTCYYDGSAYELKEELPVLDHSLGNEYISAGARLEYAKYVKNGSVKLRFANIGCTDSAENTANDMDASYICTECGDTVQVKVYRLHDNEVHITYDTNSSPCVVSGTKKYSCKYGCGYETLPERFVEENHNYKATLSTNGDGTQKIVAVCNVEGCGATVTYDGLASVAVKIKTEATCVSMGYVEYTFSYGGEIITLGAEVERGNHVLNGVDFETLKVNGKLPANTTTFIKVGSDYFFKCEECGTFVRVDVAAN